MFCQRANFAQLGSDSLPMALLLSVLYIQPASAYVDPSTGSYMLQLAIGFLFGAMFTIKAFLKRLCLKRSTRRE